MHTGQINMANGERLTLSFEKEYGLTCFNQPPGGGIRLRQEKLTCSVCQAVICLQVNEALSINYPAIRI